MNTLTLSTPLAPEIARLRDAFLQIKETQLLRDREAAHALGISEGEALAAFVGEQVIRLKPDFIALFEQVPALGSVMALTRNEVAVHEKDGAYQQMSHDGGIGLALGVIDLRVFYRVWASGFAVREITSQGTRKSLRFFDAQGQAIHKIFLREHSNHAAFDAFVGRWEMAEQTPGLVVEPAPAPALERPDDAIDVAGFHAAWAALTDTHEFFGMLRQFHVTRSQALRLAERRHAYPVGIGALRQVLEQAAQTALSIMVFVGNRGMIQIHSGPVQNIRALDTWINVLDPGFNLHVREDLLASAWVVKKPTSDGIVTSLELFDQNGTNVAMLFGERKPGQPELLGWRDLIATLPALDAKVLA